MEVTIVGKMKKPYNVDGKKGVSYKLSVCCGEYETDSFSGQVGEGAQYFELRCAESVYESVMLNDELYIDTDDKRERIKSAMMKNPDGSFSPIR